MGDNYNYDDMIGWYFVSSCKCGETAIDAIKKRLNLPEDVDIGLYPKIYYRPGPVPNVKCGERNCSLIGEENTQFDCESDLTKWCSRGVTSCIDPGLGYWIYVMSIENSSQ